MEADIITMIKSSFWTRAIDGVQQGQTDYMLSGLDHATPALRQHIINKQSRFMVHISLLDDFSTRDYCYDRGGEVVTDNDMIDYRVSQWVRKSD